MSSISMRFGAVAAFGSICLASGAPAQTPAASPSILPSPAVVYGHATSTRVSYRDLDVGSEKGMRTLAARISAAARGVCWEVNHPRELEDVYECRSESRRGAWRQFERNQQQALSSRSLVVASRPDAY